MFDCSKKKQNLQKLDSDCQSKVVSDKDLGAISRWDTEGREPSCLVVN